MVYEPLQINFFQMNRYFHLNDFFPSLQGFTLGLLKSFRAEVIVGDGFWGGLAGMMLRNITGIPFVYDYSDSYIESAGMGPLNIFFLLERLIPRSAGLTITVNYGLAEKARSFGARNVEIVTHGFEPDLFLTRHKPEKPEKHAKTALYISQLTKQPGMEILAEAVRMVPDNVSFVLVGPILDTKYFRSLIADADLKKKIILTGRVPHEEIPRHISNSDICLFLDSTETSLALFEYAAMGKPIIAFRGPVERRFVKDEEIAICDWNPKSLADAIIYLLNNKERAESMGNRIRKKVIASYSWESKTKQFIKHIETFLNSG
ncbi:glycosyltransferase [Candidatus Bathyarchaeota archaeon]|nr:glycosyltransferase [Candidatus Bathyarchaeota archaeon]